MIFGFGFFALISRLSSKTKPKRNPMKTQIHEFQLCNSSSPSCSGAKIIKPKLRSSNLVLRSWFFFFFRFWDRYFKGLGLGFCFAFEFVIWREELSWVLGDWKKRVERQWRKGKRKMKMERRKEGAGTRVATLTRTKEHELEFIKLDLLQWLDFKALLMLVF